MIKPVDSKNIAYRPDIDGLRAIAVLSVVAYHYSPGRVRGGFVGVDIFFVISGFLISSIIYKELERGAFSIVDFYIRRIRRIYPALAIVLACVCVAGWLTLLPTDFVLLGQQIVGGSTFVANFVLWWQSGYFAQDATRRPLLHLWSLGVEEQYYLFFPLICVLFYRAKKRWNLPAVFLAIATISMVINVVFVHKYVDATFYLPFSRLWELFLGAGLSLYVQRSIHTWDSHLNPTGRTVVGILGLAMLALSMVVINQYDPFPGWWGLLPTVGTVMVIFAGPLSWVNRYILSWKPAVLIGLISYPLYLWHWPILCFMRIAEEGHYSHPHEHIFHFVKESMILLAFLLAYLTYRFVETPIRLEKQKERRRRGALWLLGCVSLTGAFGVLVLMTGGFPSRYFPAVVALDHTFGNDEADTLRARTCFLDSDQPPSAFSDTCVDPAAGHENLPLVLIWGDSHAADLIPGFRALQSHAGLRLAQYTASLCPPIVGLDLPERPTCLAVNNEILDRVKTLKPDIVVLSAYWDYTGWVFQHGGFDNNYAAKLFQTIQSIKAAGAKRVVVVGSAPVWKNDVPRLLIHQVLHDPSQPVPHRLGRELTETHDDTLLKSTALQAGAEFVSIFDYLCDESTCLATTGPGWQDMISPDYAHFTGTGSTLVVEDIWASLNQHANTN